MKTHYFTWGGRVIVHSILQFFLMHDKILFDVANTLMFILFAFTIYKYAMKKGVSNSLMLGIYFLLWISIPGVGETIVIKTMSCNYVWGTTILLLFFYPFFRNVKNEWDWYFNTGTPIKGIYAVFMALVGVVAGCTIEACGAMVLFAIGCIGLYKVIKKKKNQSVGNYRFHKCMCGLCSSYSGTEKLCESFCCQWKIKYCVGTVVPSCERNILYVT